MLLPMCFRCSPSLPAVSVAERINGRPTGGAGRSRSDWRVERREPRYFGDQEVVAVLRAQLSARSVQNGCSLPCRRPSPDRRRRRGWSGPHRWRGAHRASARRPARRSGLRRRSSVTTTASCTGFFCSDAASSGGRAVEREEHVAERLGVQLLERHAGCPGRHPVSGAGVAPAAAAEAAAERSRPAGRRGHRREHARRRAIARQREMVNRRARV